MKQPELGKKILELRKRKGLTQEELAGDCKLNVRTLQRIESGEVNPRSYTVRTVFAALDYSGNVEELDRPKLLSRIISNYGYLKEKLRTDSEMKSKSSFFFYHFFLAIGVVWFFSACAILIYELNFQRKEILMTLIFPMAYAILRLFEKRRS